LWVPGCTHIVPYSSLITHVVPMRFPPVYPHGSLVGPRLNPHHALFIPNYPCGSHEGPQVYLHGSRVGPRLYPHRALLIPITHVVPMRVPQVYPHGSLVVPRLYPHYGNPPVFVSGDPVGSLWDKLPMWFP